MGGCGDGEQGRCPSMGAFRENEGVSHQGKYTAASRELMFVLVSAHIFVRYVLEHFIIFRMNCHNLELGEKGIILYSRLSV